MWYSLCNLRREPQCIVMGEGISNDSTHSIHIATTSIKHLVLQHQQSLDIYILAWPLQEKTLLIWIVSDNDSLLGLFPIPPPLLLCTSLMFYSLLRGESKLVPPPLPRIPPPQGRNTLLSQSLHGSHGTTQNVISIGGFRKQCVTTNALRPHWGVCRKKTRRERGAYVHTMCVYILSHCRLLSLNM